MRGCGTACDRPPEPANAAAIQWRHIRLRDPRDRLIHGALRGRIVQGAHCVGRQHPRPRNSTRADRTRLSSRSTSPMSPSREGTTTSLFSSAVEPSHSARGFSARATTSRNERAMSRRLTSDASCAARSVCSSERSLTRASARSRSIRPRRRRTRTHASPPLLSVSLKLGSCIRDVRVDAHVGLRFVGLSCREEYPQMCASARRVLMW